MIVKHFSIEAILLASEEIHTIEIISSVDGMGIFTPLDSLGRGPWPLGRGGDRSYLLVVYLPERSS